MATGTGLRGAALGVLREGRVTITYAASVPAPGHPDRDEIPPYAVRATVTASQPGQGPWYVACVGGWWSCTCPNADDKPTCKHAAAVAMCTGWPTPARKDDA